MSRAYPDGPGWNHETLDQASAYLPNGWEPRGVVKAPRQADPAIHSAAWTAWATGDGQRAESHGDSAEAAMADRANQLLRIRQDQNG